MRSCNVVNFFFSSRRRHTRSLRDWSSDVCSSDLHRENRAGSAACRERVEVGRVRGLERCPPVELGDRVVPQPVQTDVQQRGRHRYFTIKANSSGSRLAPPTSAPSISGCAMNSRMLPGLTLPPYWTRIPCARASSYLVE